MAPPRHRSSTDDIFTEPQRLHKVLASCGFGSRRAMEEMILAGRITVNREPADVGQKVGPGDEVRINGELVRVRFAEPRARILMYHKPAGEIVTRDDPEGRPTVFEKLPNIGNGRWIAIGRLDFNTEGLLLFTNAGELANKMMHPRYEVEREYAVRVMGLLTPEHEQALLAGVTLDDGPGKVETLVDGGGEGSNHWYHVVIKEGRNREVRRLFEALGLTVSRLIRTRYGTVAMPSRVKRGQTLELTADEVGAVLVAAGLKATGAPPPKPGQGGKPRGQGGRHQGQAGRQPGQPGRQPGQPGRPQGSGGRPQGNGPRPPGQGQRERGPRGPQREGFPPRDAAPPDMDAPPDVDAIEPGNSVHGLPTHGNTPVGKFFAKTHAKPHGRPQGPGGPRRGPHAGQGKGGRAFPQQGRPQHAGKPHRPPGGGAHGASPYVMTTLTVPGAVPEGLPGTEGRRPKGLGAGNGPRGPGAGPGKNRGRGDRNRRDEPAGESPGNAAPRVAQSAPVDDDIGNRLPRPAKSQSAPANDPPRRVEPASIDDDIGNR